MWLSEAFDRAFHSLRNNFRPWLGLAVINAVLGLPLVFIQPEDISDFTSPLLWSSVLAILLNIMITPGMLAMGLAGAQAKTVSLELIIKKLPLFFKYLGFSIIYTVAISAGLLALIIPGFYLMARFGLAPFLMVEDESLGVFDALKKSGDIMKGQYIKVLFNIFIIFLVSIFTLMLFSIFTFFFASNTTGGILAQNAFLIIPSTIVTPVIYVGLGVIYRGLIKNR